MYIRRDFIYLHVHPSSDINIYTEDVKKKTFKWQAYRIYRETKVAVLKMH